jgi:alkanesulfonate monooxygenase SsuD/methylene tetrahydromethanopterin reductase-like flavin-dependent oxidoreductase (luciferase family)
MRRAVRLADGWHPLRLSPEELAPLIDELKGMAAREGKPVPFISLHGEWIRIAGVGNWREREGKRLPLNGTPDQLVEDIRRYEELGVQHLVLRFGAAESVEEFYEALDIFEKRVRPHIAEG